MGLEIKKPSEVHSIPLNVELPTRERIQELQAAMLPVRDDCPKPDHFFAPGQYGRRLAIPAGMLIVGKIHKHDHLMMLLKGRALVISEFGADEIEAGYVSVSKAGVKRIVYAIEDTVFVTVHNNPDNTEDLGVIEESHIEYEGFIPDYHIGVDKDDSPRIGGVQ